jgi:broad specificity phosphatase PhoE
MQIIYVVRHGETAANVAKKVNDKNVVTPLNKNGKSQALKTGKHFKNNIKKPNDKIAIYSSPSIRAVETAEIIANELKIDKNDIIKDDRINETDNGIVSGTGEGDAIYEAYMKEYNKFPKDPVEYELLADKIDKIIYKKFKCETGKHIEARVKDFYDSLPKNKKIIVVTHRGIVQFTIRVLFNVRHNIMGDITNGANCSLTSIIKDKDKYSLITLPNTLHLK